MYSKPVDKGAGYRVWNLRAARSGVRYCVVSLCNAPAPKMSDMNGVALHVMTALGGGLLSRSLYI